MAKVPLIPPEWWDELVLTPEEELDYALGLLDWHMCRTILDEDLDRKWAEDRKRAARNARRRERRRERKLEAQAQAEARARARAELWARAQAQEQNPAHIQLQAAGGTQASAQL